MIVNNIMSDLTLHYIIVFKICNLSPKAKFKLNIQISMQFVYIIQILQNLIYYACIYSIKTEIEYLLPLSRRLEKIFTGMLQITL